MIYVTVSTRNRFWHCALTMLTLAQAVRTGCFVHVLDDASDDHHADAKRDMLIDLENREIVHRYERLDSRIGFCRGRELFVDRFLAEERFSHWFHLDDDILVGSSVLQNSVNDLRGPLKDDGVLHVYLNPWAGRERREDDFDFVRKIGGACYVVSRPTMQTIGNPYEGQNDGEKANLAFWRAIRQAGQEMYCRRKNPHPCQHSGNVESSIFGKTPKWEALYAVDEKRRPMSVPPFDIAEMRPAIRLGRLHEYVWRMNADVCRVKVKLPNPNQPGFRP